MDDWGGGVNGVDGMDGLVLNRIEKVVETGGSPREAVPQGAPHGVGNLGLGAIGDALNPLFGLLETRILGIPVWAIGAGVAAYFLFLAPKKGRHATNPDMDDNDDDYGYED